MAEPRQPELRATRLRARVDDWALVLAAEGFSAEVHREHGWYVLRLAGTSAGDANRALAVLDAYERENPPAPEEPEPHLGEPSQMGTVVAACFTLFFAMVGPQSRTNLWFERGTADAGLILAGEYWRTVTALTLHSGIAHVAANAVFGAILINSVCAAVGPGVGVAAVLLAGVGGNWMNAAAYEDFHSSIGASTAVFGALGVLCGPAIARRRRSGLRGRRLLTPLAAGLGLIAMLGVGGVRTDVWAHLFGFISGVMVGVPLAMTLEEPPGPGVQLFCGLAALAVTIGSWRVAFAG